MLLLQGDYDIWASEVILFWLADRKCGILPLLDVNILGLFYKMAGHDGHKTCQEVPYKWFTNLYDPGYGGGQKGQQVG